MKKIVITLAVFSIFSCVFIFADDLAEVRIEQITIRDSFDTIQYGARLEPNFIYEYFAPITGIVDTIFVAEGNFVNAGAQILSIRRRNQSESFQPVIVTANVSGVITDLTVRRSSEVVERNAIFSIADISRYKMNLLISDKDIPLLRVNDTVYIKDGDRITGRITNISMLPDMRTGLFNVEVSFSRSPSLFSGKFVLVEMRVNPFSGIMINNSRVIRKFGKTFVFVYLDGKVQMREIAIDRVIGEDAIVSSGLSQGESIVTWFSKRLNDGDQVVIAARRPQTGQSGSQGQQQ